MMYFVLTLIVLLYIFYFIISLLSYFIIRQIDRKKPVIFLNTPKSCLICKEIYEGFPNMYDLGSKTTKRGYKLIIKGSGFSMVGFYEGDRVYIRKPLESYNSYVGNFIVTLPEKRLNEENLDLELVSNYESDGRCITKFITTSGKKISPMNVLGVVYKKESYDEFRPV